MPAIRSVLQCAAVTVTVMVAAPALSTQLPSFLNLASQWSSCTAQPFSQGSEQCCPLMFPTIQDLTFCLLSPLTASGVPAVRKATHSYISSDALLSLWFLSPVSPKVPGATPVHTLCSAHVKTTLTLLVPPIPWPTYF